MFRKMKQNKLLPTQEKFDTLIGATTEIYGRLVLLDSVRIDGKVIGNRTKIKIVKNKVAPPFTEVEFDIMYDEGISKMGSLIDLGIEHKILEKKGAWIAYEGALVGQGRDAAKAALKEKPELAEKISKAIMEKVVITATGPKADDDV